MPLTLMPSGAEVDRHALGQHLHRALARGVGRDARPAELALHRADVDDAAAVARDHAPRHRLADVEDAVEVGAHHACQSASRSPERRAALHAGVVDEDVDRAELGLDRVDRRVDRRGVASRRTHVRATVRPSARRLPRPRSLPASRPLSTTAAPACARPRASARPMPADEPVTSASRPSSRNVVRCGHRDRSSARRSAGC